MAFWEWENWPDLAVKTAILNIQNLPKINKIIKEIIPNFPKEINCRIWLHKWAAIVWDLGSENYKLNYTAIGDTVNLASRLEGINKFYNTQICASETVIENLKEEDLFLFRLLDKIKVKWKEQSIKIYQIFPYFTKFLNKYQIDRFKNLIKKFEEGLKYYFSGQFQEAKEIFDHLYKIFDDKTSKIFLDRCQYLIKNPPTHWNWIWKFDKK